MGRYHEVDVTAPKPVERMIGGALRVEADVSQLVAPRERRCLILESADRLPVLEASVPDQHG